MVITMDFRLDLAGKLVSRRKSRIGQLPGYILPYWVDTFESSISNSHPCQDVSWPDHADLHVLKPEFATRVGSKMWK
jgi:hypothetical protein